MRIGLEHGYSCTLAKDINMSISCLTDLGSEKINPRNHKKLTHHSSSIIIKVKSHVD